MLLHTVLKQSVVTSPGLGRCGLCHRPSAGVAAGPGRWRDRALRQRCRDGCRPRGPAPLEAAQPQSRLRGVVSSLVSLVSSAEGSTASGPRPSP